MPSQDEAQEIKQFLVENGLITEDQEPDDSLAKAKLADLQAEAKALEMESARQEILAHVKENGYWSPPEFKGGYAKVLFTHDQFRDYMQEIEEKYDEQPIEQEHFPSSIWQFEVDGQIYYHEVMCGQGCTNDLFTKEYYEERCGPIKPLQEPLLEKIQRLQWSGKIDKLIIDNDRYFAYHPTNDTLVIEGDPRELLESGLAHFEIDWDNA